MSLTDAQFVLIPNFYKLDQTNLQYLDILIYTALKSFDNDDEDCFPMHETIGKRARLSRRFVIDSIKRLETSGFISVIRSAKKHVSNHYFFNKLERFEQIPYDLFEQPDLTPNEKAMLICLRQFFIHGPLQCGNDITFFARWLGLTYNTIVPIYKSLVDKGYILERVKIYRNKPNSTIVRILSDKIEWREMKCVRYLFQIVCEPKIIYPNLKVA